MNKESLRTLKGIGEKTEKLFERAGICNLNQLLHYYPREYDAYQEPLPYSQLRENEKNAIYALIQYPPSVKTANGKSVTLLQLQDQTGQLQVVWFRMPFLKSYLKRGGSYVFRGRVVYKNGRRTMEHPEIFTPASYEEVRGRLRPLYPLVSGLTNKMVVKAIRQLLEELPPPSDFLPEEYRRYYGLCDLREALTQVHFPSSPQALKGARHRLIFDEFFLFLLNLEKWKDQTALIENHFPMKAVWKTEEIMENLPYSLTDGQLQVWNELEKDLKGKNLMSRLIQGDVGSGKTILAFLAMIMCYENGYQSALMAPTEVLAVQHYEALCRLLRDNQIQDAHPVLLRGSCTPREKREIYEQIASGSARMIIGTHALIQEKVLYANLALVITDEQHRFGVRQRSLLTEKGYPPHVLVMSATPIPRTLAIILYGDLSISVLKELPARRLPVKNCVVNTQWRPNAYRFIQKEVEAGRQAYIICPMVEANEEISCENVMDYSKRLREILPDSIRVEVLYGQMKAQKKNEVMEAFAANQIQVLVSTTVVEVGVNVPNATIMMIENAEHFGLAQLHQLRGRVGRGECQSYCIFMQENSDEGMSRRLQILNQSNDGFYIAEEDLKLRGPGDFFGIRQSGMMNFQIADIYQDSGILKEALEAVQDLLTRDPELAEEEHQQLKKNCETYGYLL